MLVTVQGHETIVGASAVRAGCEGFDELYEILQAAFIHVFAFSAYVTGSHCDQRGICLIAMFKRACIHTLYFYPRF